MTSHTATDQDRKCSTMTTPEPHPTPINVRRQATITDAVGVAERLATVLRQYRGAQKNGCPMSRLAEIEAVLEQTTNAVFEMTGVERSALLKSGAAAEEEVRLRIAAAWPVPRTRTEPTLPASAVLHSISGEDCD